MNDPEPQPVTPASPEPEPSIPPITPPKIDGYEILGELGQGETGIVWRARQLEPDREVALKLLPAAVFGSESARKRFERDCTIAAGLQHPNLARLYEVSLENEVYCWAAELIEGLPLDEYAQTVQLTAPEAVGLVARICEAVQHAHQHGLIHGNLKPTNILVDVDGQPHVLDLALDRAYWNSEAAAEAAADEKVEAGLPVFLAPEALAGLREELDSRADVYSLAALLLWLLTGESSYDEASHDPRIVDSADPELQALFRRALAANPELRYATVGELGADLGRYLRDEPLSVMPVTAAYLLRKACRRHRAALGLGLAGLVLVGGWFGFGLWRNRADRDNAQQQAAQIQAEKQRVQDALERTRVELAQERASRVEPPKPPEPVPEPKPAVATPDPLDELVQAFPQVLAQIQAGNHDAAATLLWQIPAQDRQWEWGRLLALCHRDLYTFAAGKDSLQSLAVAPDGRWFVTGGHTGARVWSLDGRQLLALPVANGPVTAVTISPDGRRVAAGCADGTVRLWGSLTGQNLATAKNIPSPRALAYNEEGWLLLAAGDEQLSLQVLDPRTGLETTKASLAENPTCAAFSPDRKLLASGHLDGRVLVWNTATGRLLWEFKAHTGATTALAFLPDGTRLVSAGQNLQVRFWEVRDGRETGSWQLAGAPIETIAPSTDGSRLVTGSRDRSLSVWDLATGTPLVRWAGHAGPVRQAAFLPDGRRLISASLDGTARLWRADKPDDLIACQDDPACAKSFRSLTTLKDEPPRKLQRTEDGAWVVTEAGTGQETSRLQDSSQLKAATLTEDCQRVIGTQTAGLAVWDANSGRRLLVLSEGCGRAVGRSPVPRRVVVQACERELWLWDAADWSLTRDQFDAQRRAALASRRP